MQLQHVVTHMLQCACPSSTQYAHSQGLTTCMHTWLSLRCCCGCGHARQPEICAIVVPGGQAKQAFVISLLQSMTEVLGLRNVSEIGVQTAQYDGSPLSLALQKLEEMYLKQSQVSFGLQF